MTLAEKIYTCRKKAGLSQEALAEKLGVSRQSVSKWENGDASPELDKLLLLAKVFEVTTDWLLTPDAPEEQEEEPRPQREPDWVDNLHGHLGRFIRRYGWLAGVHVALSGLGAMFIGVLARFAVQRMFTGFNVNAGGFQTGGFQGGLVMSPGDFDMLMNSQMNSQMMDMQRSMLANNPVMIFGTAVMIAGGLVTAAGVALAIYLKKRSKHL